MKTLGTKIDNNLDDKPKPITQGKILDYNGNVIGTF